MDVSDLLSRLSKVKSTGPMKWSACCPAHEDRSPSLAVREMADGRILVHCFGGCGASDIVGSLGLELADLMPPPTEHHYAPVRRPWNDGDVLRALASEAVVIAVATANLLDGALLTNEDLERLTKAAGVIEQAMEHINGLS